MLRTSIINRRFRVFALVIQALRLRLSKGWGLIPLGFAGLGNAGVDFFRATGG